MWCSFGEALGLNTCSWCRFLNGCGIDPYRPACATSIACVCRLNSSNHPVSDTKLPSHEVNLGLESHDLDLVAHLLFAGLQS